MSKTERALEEPGLDDAPDDLLTELGGDTDSNGSLPAPTFAPPQQAQPGRAEDPDDGRQAENAAAADVSDERAAPGTASADPGSNGGSNGNGARTQEEPGEELGDDLSEPEPMAPPSAEGAEAVNGAASEPLTDDAASGSDPAGVTLFDGEALPEPDHSPVGLPAPVVHGWEHAPEEVSEDAPGEVGDETEAAPDDESDPALTARVGTFRPSPGTIPGEALRVSPPGADVLEELRRANIDGPTVEFAPQDDTGSSARRPHRLREYDPAPIPIPAKVPRLLGRKPRVRKVTRVVRHVDPWSVFKIAIVANLVLYVIALTSGVLLWNVANATGTVDNVERFFESFGWSSFEFNGGEIYHSAWIAGLFLVIGLTGLAVLLATLFNLITDLVGGMRFTVLEEEVVETRTSPMRRFVVRRAEPEVPAIDRDESGAVVREAVVDDSGAIVRRSR